MHPSEAGLGGRGTKRNQTGFSLIEVVVAAALLGLIGATVASLYGVSTRSTNATTAAANALSAIDSDISRVKQLSEQLTCCPGSCTTDTTTIASAVTSGKCVSSTPGLSSYYWPQATADITTFTTACTATSSNGAIETAMITGINALAQPSGAVRTASVDEISAHRITVTYTGTTGSSGSFVNRTIKVVPTVAMFCP